MKKLKQIFFTGIKDHTSIEVKQDEVCFEDDGLTWSWTGDYFKFTTNSTWYHILGLPVWRFKSQTKKEWWGTPRDYFNNPFV